MKRNAAIVAAMTALTALLLATSSAVFNYFGAEVVATTKDRKTTQQQRYLPTPIPNTNITAVSLIRKGTGSCGVSCKTQMNDGREYFFKASVTETPDYHGAETHLQEIGASRLNDILHFSLAPACRGYRLYKQDLQHLPEPPQHGDDKLYHVQDIFRLGGCSAGGGGNTSYVSGSLMDWLPNGLELVSHIDIAKLATSNFALYHPSARHLLRNAVQYATFHYLGACMRTDHNHFLTRIDNDDTTTSNGTMVDITLNADVGDAFKLPKIKKRKRIEQRTSYQPTHRFVAIDNDRCFQMRRTSLDEDVPEYRKVRITFWEYLVLERIPCSSFEPSLVARVLELVAAKRSNRTSASDLLLDGLQEDALSTDLLPFYLRDEAILRELEERIEILATRFEKECSYGSGLT